MSPHHAILTCYRRAFDWGGRATLGEFWWWSLYHWVLVVGLAMLFGPFFETMSNLLLVFLILFMVVHLIPFLGVVVRRWRDSGRSGLWLVLLFIPWINVIAFFVIGLTPSKPVQYSGVERVE